MPGRACSRHLRFQIGGRYRRYQILFRQGLQHFFIALTAADLLPAPPVKSRFVAVDSRHLRLLIFVPATASRRFEILPHQDCAVPSITKVSVHKVYDGHGPANTHERASCAQSRYLGFEKLSEFPRFDTSLAFQGISQSRRRNVLLGCLRGQDLYYTLYAQAKIMLAFA
jgi:hypothetical protein